MNHLVLVRHGESLWNKENRFTGWTDIDLSSAGVAEAQSSGQTLKDRGYHFDAAYTSVLKRAIRTLWIILDEMDLMWIPVVRSWRLNERNYGSLQGLNKVDMVEQYGEKQVQLWRRSFDISPPALPTTDPRHPSHDPKYNEIPRNELPSAESLQQTVGRLFPYWENIVKPTIRQGKRTLIVAHGNSLRALVKILDGLSDEQIVQLNIPTGIPLVYELDSELKPVTHYYLGDDEKIKKSIDSVANQLRPVTK